MFEEADLSALVEEGGALRPASTSPVFIRTPDGWELALHHPYSSRGQSLPPVLLLPGHGTSAVSYRPTEPDSLPAYLRMHGFDPWVLDFRGTGRSRYVERGRPVVCIDRKIQFDLPTAIQAVQQHTGSVTVDLVGHSMGGIVAYGYLAVYGTASVRRLVTMSSPGYFRPTHDDGTPVFRLRARVLRHSLRLVNRLPTRQIMRMVSRLPVRGAFGMHFNPENVTDKQARVFVRESSTDMYRAELEQILGWFETGEIMNRSRTFSYTEHFHRITTPALFIVATGDRIVDRKAVRHVFESVSSAEKDLVEVGTSTGATVDFGHTDLIAGRHAPRDVFPHVTRWLARP